MNVIMGATLEVKGDHQQKSQRNASPSTDGHSTMGKDSGRNDSGVENDVFAPDEGHQQNQRPRFNNNNNNNIKNQQNGRTQGSKRSNGATKQEMDTLEKVKNEKFYTENEASDNKRSGRGDSHKKKMYYNQQQNNRQSVKEYFVPNGNNKSHRLPQYDAVEEEGYPKNSHVPKKRGESCKNNNGRRQGRGSQTQKNDEVKQNRRRTIAEDGLGAGRTKSVLKNPTNQAAKYQYEMDKFAMHARKERSKRASQAREEHVNAISKQRDFVPSSRK